MVTKLESVRFIRLGFELSWHLPGLLGFSLNDRYSRFRFDTLAQSNWINTPI